MPSAAAPARMKSAAFFWSTPPDAISGICQALDNLPPDEVTKEVRLGGFRDVFQIVDLALAQSVQHEGAVVVEGDEIHFRLIFYSWRRELVATC